MKRPVDPVCFHDGGLASTFHCHRNARATYMYNVAGFDRGSQRRISRLRAQGNDKNKIGDK